MKMNVKMNCVDSNKNECKYEGESEDDICYFYMADDTYLSPEAVL